LFLQSAIMEQNRYQLDLDQNGYVHITYPNSLTLDEVQSIFGPSIFKTLIQENPSSTRLLASNLDVDFHTDHIKAKFIAWRCESQASIGGESLLLDGKHILRNANKEILNSLQDVTVKCHRLFYGDRPDYPLYSEKTGILYYASFLSNNPIGPKAKEAFTWFQNQVLITPFKELKLSEGDWLIIDNHRMLHARRGFLPNSNRILTRYWLSGLANK
jgi:hypothetical protein